MVYGGSQLSVNGGTGSINESVTRLQIMREQTMNISDILLLLVFNELMIIGIWTMCASGMILDILGETVFMFLGDKWSKPITECVPCMASTWGTLIWFWVQGFSFESLLTWPVYVFALCGLGKLVVSFLPK